MNPRSRWYIEALSHAVLLLAVAFALYPVLWVVSLALSPSGTPSPHALPLPDAGELQSGALAAALLDYAKGRGIGFSRFVSFGNKADINEIGLMMTGTRQEALYTS